MQALQRPESAEAQPADSGAIEMNDSVAGLTEALRRFAAVRDWDKFHTPKNLAMSLMIEAAEVAEHFQWDDGGTSDTMPIDGPKRDAIALEIADTLLYLVRLSDRLGIDPIAAAVKKLAINAERYPVDRSFGHARKYDDL